MHHAPRRASGILAAGLVLAAGALVAATPAAAAPSQQVPCDIKAQPYKRTFPTDNGSIQDLAYHSQVDITCKAIGGRQRAGGLRASGSTEQAKTLTSRWRAWGAGPGIGAEDRYPDANGFHVRLILHASCLPGETMYFRQVLTVDAPPAPGSGHTPFRHRGPLRFQSPTLIDCDPSRVRPATRDLGKSMTALPQCSRNISGWTVAPNRRSAHADVTSTCNGARSHVATDQTFTVWRSTLRGSLLQTRPFERVTFTTRPLPTGGKDMATRVTVPISTNSWNAHRLDVTFGFQQHPHPPLQPLRLISRGNGPIQLLRGPVDVIR